MEIIVSDPTDSDFTELHSNIIISNEYALVNEDACKYALSDTWSHVIWKSRDPNQNHVTFPLYKYKKIMFNEKIYKFALTGVFVIIFLINNVLLSWQPIRLEIEHNFV
jgi:hypothetical protein